jgi:hypothetical protein
MVFFDPSFQPRLGDLAGACYFLGRHHEAENFARQMLAIAIMQPQPVEAHGRSGGELCRDLRRRPGRPRAGDRSAQAGLWPGRPRTRSPASPTSNGMPISWPSPMRRWGSSRNANDVLTKYQPRKETFPDRNLVTVFRFFWRLFNLGFKFRKPQEAILDANIAYIAAALPKIGLRSDTREIYFLMEMMKARLLKFRGKKPEAKEAFAKIYDTYLNEFPVA